MADRGFILFEGPSLIDGKPIVVIAIMKTRNPKTGDMVQTFILRSDIAPHEAVKQGEDVSICGDCVHRPANQGSCYVTVFQAPLQVFKSYKADKYSRDLDVFYRLIATRLVRFGAYGDPAAAPAPMWAEIANNCAGNTGYTHQFDQPGFDLALLDHVMLSADTESQAIKYNEMGLRYFRTIREGDDTIQREIECLADSMGKTCAECTLCDGGTKGKSVYINIHGAKASRFNPDLIAVS